MLPLLFIILVQKRYQITSWDLLTIPSTENELLNIVHASFVCLRILNQKGTSPD